jgi:hypothetical protein
VGERAIEHLGELGARPEVCGHRAAHEQRRQQQGCTQGLHYFCGCCERLGGAQAGARAKMQQGRYRREGVVSQLANAGWLGQLAIRAVLETRVDAREREAGKMNLKSHLGGLEQP